MNTQNLICWMLGFATASSLATICFLVANRTIKNEGQKIIDKMVAKKQVDFFYNETIRIFLMAAEAQQFGDSELLDKLARQHGLAVRRFEEAKRIMLEMEMK